MKETLDRTRVEKESVILDDLFGRVFGLGYDVEEHRNILTTVNDWHDVMKKYDKTRYKIRGAISSEVSFVDLFVSAVVALIPAIVAVLLTLHGVVTVPIFTAASFVSLFIIFFIFPQVSFTKPDYHVITVKQYSDDDIEDFAPYELYKSISMMDIDRDNELWDMFGDYLDV